jgi:hypothetical protein
MLGLDKRHYKKYHQERFCCDYVDKLIRAGKYDAELKFLAKFNEETVHHNFSQSLKQTTEENPNKVDFFKTKEERQPLYAEGRAARNDYISRSRKTGVAYGAEIESSVLSYDYLFEGEEPQVKCKNCKKLKRKERPENCQACIAATAKLKAKKTKPRSTFALLLSKKTNVK